jgi:hypothetical protein
MNAKIATPPPCATPAATNISKFSKHVNRILFQRKTKTLALCEYKHAQVQLLWQKESGLYEWTSTIFAT